MRFAANLVFLAGLLLIAGVYARLALRNTGADARWLWRVRGAVVCFALAAAALAVAAFAGVSGVLANDWLWLAPFLAGVIVAPGGAGG